jgi:hypothetical protein
LVRLHGFRVFSRKSGHFKKRATILAFPPRSSCRRIRRIPASGRSAHAANDYSFVIFSRGPRQKRERANETTRAFRARGQRMPPGAALRADLPALPPRARGFFSERFLGSWFLFGLARRLSAPPLANFFSAEQKLFSECRKQLYKNFLISGYIGSHIFYVRTRSEWLSIANLRPTKKKRS